MIRLHVTAGDPQGGDRYYGNPALRIRVSSKRKPRGFVRQARVYYREVTGDGRFEISVSEGTTLGWVPISMKGREGKGCSTLERAVEVIMTDRRFQEDADAR